MLPILSAELLRTALIGHEGQSFCPECHRWVEQSNDLTLMPHNNPEESEALCDGTEKRCLIDAIIQAEGEFTGLKRYPNLLLLGRA